MSQETLDLAVSALLGAVDKDPERVIAAVSALDNAPALYGACEAWAEAARLGGGLNEEGGYWIIQADDGRAIDDCASDEAVWSLRYLTAHMNDERQDTLAMFMASEAAGLDVLVRRVHSLLDLCAQIVRTSPKEGEAA